MAKKPYHISSERSHSGYSVIVHRIEDEASDAELLRQEISEILVELVRLARKRRRPRLRDIA